MLHLHCTSREIKIFMLEKIPKSADHELKQNKSAERYDRSSTFVFDVSD